MADKRELVEPNCLAEPFQVCDKGLTGVVAAGRPITFSPSTLIQGEDVIVLAEFSRNVVPLLAMPAQAVKKNNLGLAFVAPVQIMQVDAINADSPVFGLHRGGHLISL